MPRISDPGLLAQLETPQTAINGGGAPKGAPAASKSGIAADQRAKNMIALGRKFADVRDRYNRDFKGVGPGSLLEYLPTPRNKAFDSAGAGLSDIANAVFKIPGNGAQSDADFAAFVRANQPQHGDADEVIEAKLSNIRNRLTSSGIAIPPPASERKGQFKVISR